MQKAEPPATTTADTSLLPASTAAICDDPPIYA